jgi:aminoglycoside phosphotransferase (APT) family kinase protein
VDEARDLVRRAFPGRAVQVEGEGQLSWAFRVDNELVVRVPRHAFGVERLRYEVALLAAIRPRLTVTVPEIVDAILDRPAGEAYVVHRCIPGRILDLASVEAMEPSRLESVGRQIGIFLRELHAIDVADLDAPRLTPSGFAAQLAAEVDAVPSDVVTKTQVAGLHRTLRALATVPDSPMVLCHTDIGGNILVDDADGSVGVIDFGSCFVTHPALDVASLSVLGTTVLVAAASEYPLLGALSAEADAVRQTFMCQDVLYGARQQDWDYIRSMFSEEN